MTGSTRIAVLGGGNLGRALARGWVESGRFEPSDVTVTRRSVGKLADLADEGMTVTSDNAGAVEGATTVVVAVQPQQVEGLLDAVRDSLEPGRHRVVSVATGVSIATLRDHLADGVPAVRAMPNTAVHIGEAMTCLCADPADGEALAAARELFGALGRTLELPEEMMTPATALCACGVAFFLRCVRAASQGGIEIGFHPEEALLLAAQTARGAASLLLEPGAHPESEIDRVTTPRGCTIAGLNEMEHHGLSSALIRGIVVSARKAEALGD
ncbi:MAG TPA: pyrroline-5-carboxylate reductase [Longimicrobiales bacterium]|nr:pyrroline-5-carboxylate reductase [Longimicrobiales bacterium]